MVKLITRNRPLPILSMDEQLELAADGIECSGICDVGEDRQMIRYFTIKKTEDIESIDFENLSDETFLHPCFLTLTDLGPHFMLTLRHPKKWRLFKDIKNIFFL